MFPQAPSSELAWMLVGVQGSEKWVPAQMVRALAVLEYEYPQILDLVFDSESVLTVVTAMYLAHSAVEPEEITRLLKGTELAEDTELKELEYYKDSSVHARLKELKGACWEDCSVDKLGQFSSKIIADYVKSLTILLGQLPELEESRAGLLAASISPEQVQDTVDFLKEIAPGSEAEMFQAMPLATLTAGVGRDWASLGLGGQDLLDVLQDRLPGSSKTIQGLAGERKPQRANDWPSVPARIARLLESCPSLDLTQAIYLISAPVIDQREYQKRAVQLLS